MNRNESPQSDTSEALGAYLDLRNVIVHYTSTEDLVDLNRPDMMMIEKENEKYTIQKFHLPVDEVRRSADAMRKLIESLDPLERKDAEELLLQADIYLAAHDENQEKEVRDWKLLTPNTNMTLEELNGFKIKEGVSTISYKEQLDKQLMRKEITMDEYYRLLSEQQP